MNPTSETIPQETIPFLEIGTGFLIGLSIGYVLKKSFKIVLFLLGLGLIGVFLLESQGMLVLDEANLESTVSKGWDTFKNLTLFLQERLEQLEMSSGLSTIAGFFAGLKMG